MTVNTDYLQINFSNCVAVLHTCSFYKLWFDIIFMDQNGKVIALKEETYVNHNRKEKSQVSIRSMILLEIKATLVYR